MLDIILTGKKCKNKFIVRLEKLKIGISVFIEGVFQLISRNLRHHALLTALLQNSKSKNYFLSEYSQILYKTVIIQNGIFLFSFCCRREHQYQGRSSGRLKCAVVKACQDWNTGTIELIWQTSEVPCKSSFICELLDDCYN